MSQETGKKPAADDGRNGLCLERKVGDEGQAVAINTVLPTKLVRPVRTLYTKSTYKIGRVNRRYPLEKEK